MGIVLPAAAHSWLLLFCSSSSCLPSAALLLLSRAACLEASRSLLCALPSKLVRLLRSCRDDMPPRSSPRLLP